MPYYTPAQESELLARYVKDGETIAALRARVERLEVEMKHCLWAIENGGFSEDSLGMKIAKDARAVLEAK